MNEILDFKSLNKKMLISVVGALILLFGIRQIDMSSYGDLASAGLAVFVFTLVLMVFSGLNTWLICLIMGFVGIAFRIWGWDDISAYLGSSNFYSMLGMSIVAMGVEFTPLGKRVAYLFLKFFGQKPKLLVIAFGIVTTMISALVSNLATIILMSSIADTILKEMDEKPGESRIGKAVMLIITVGGMLGGCVLFSGSPFGNAMMLSVLTQATGYTITYGQWAFFGTITFLICTVPVCLIYAKCFKVSNEGFHALPKEHYDQKLKELGRISGAEIRWIVIVTVMIGLMIAGQTMALIAMLFATIAMTPGVGVVDMNKALEKLPIQVLFVMGIGGMIANLITDTGVVEWISEFVTPIFEHTSPFVFSLLASVITGIIINVTINAGFNLALALLAVLGPLCVSLGYNPSVVLLPTIFAGSFFWCMAENNYVMLNRGYGYWEHNDPMLPGYISTMFVNIAMPVICCFLCGIIGLSVYI